jgi:hypothetical protein
MSNQDIDRAFGALTDAIKAGDDEAAGVAAVALLGATVKLVSVMAAALEAITAVQQRKEMQKTLQGH